jgi:hypothetical protein
MWENLPLPDMPDQLIAFKGFAGCAGNPAELLDLVGRIVGRRVHGFLADVKDEHISSRYLLNGQSLPLGHTVEPLFFGDLVVVLAHAENPIAWH